MPFLLRNLLPGLLNKELSLETEKLARCWEQHEGGWLRNYLVSGVEDPRVNLQSIFSRHFIIRALAAQRFEALVFEECRFAAVMDWLARVARLANDPEGRAVTLDALARGRDNAEGLEIPPFVLQAFADLPCRLEACTIPNYIEAFLRWEETPGTSSQKGEPALEVLGDIWRELLSGPAATRSCGHGEAGGGAPARQSLVEPACGSANDYRFLYRYGIAPLLDYTGFDLCLKNVENASALFPGAHFERGNVFEISAGAKQFDLCVVHDLLEHLSIAGMEQAVSEICRVTRAGVCVGFFQMDEIPRHIVRPRDDYYWNLLSLDQMKRLFASHGFETQAIHVRSYLSQRFGWSETHNPNAYTFVCRRTPRSE